MSIQKASVWAQIICGICAPIALFFAAAVFFGWTPRTLRGLGIVSPPVGLAVIILLLVVVPWATIIAAKRAVPAGSAPQAAPVFAQIKPSALIEGWKLTKLREFLSDKPKGSVRVVGEEGDPIAYSFSKRLANAFEQSGWTVNQGSLGLHFSAEKVFVVDHMNEVSKYSSLIREALVASGIPFERFKMRDAEFVVCTVYITAQS
jgi:4-amino-4-deoxy-L-arabinose transferase-like glycosyltransferase